jgi:hypothetical protein
VIRQAVTVVVAFQRVIAVAPGSFLNRVLASLQGMQAGCPLMPMIVTVVAAHRQQPRTCMTKLSRADLLPAVIVCTLSW